MTLVPGVGHIPETWDTQRAKWLMNRERRSTNTTDQVVTAFRDGRVTLRANRRLDGFTEAVQEIGYQGIRNGDLVVHSMDGFAGAIGVSDSDGKASPVVHAYTPKPRTDLRYYAYILRQMALNGRITSLAKGIRERSTAFDAPTLANLVLPLPPLEEQRRIADFLDAETVRIGKAVETMRRQENLLAERRHHILDLSLEQTQDAPRFRLGYATTLVTSGSRGWGTYATDSGALFFRSANLHSDSIQPKLSSVTYVSLPKEAIVEATRSRIQIGDVLIGITGANAGWVALANNDVADGYVSQHVCLTRPETHKIDSEWLAFLIASPSTQRGLMESQYGGTKTQLSLPDIRNIQVPSISLNRQREVAREIKRQVRLVDRQRRLRRRQTELLGERREALITAAVTGQFDVSTASGRGVTE
ncbi:restriction endonuclease subunit S [Actinomadura monticuli]|uniref:Restriction endonuclease subunit S n=1 Tax=Actinomadura monticuli TaxID=3097367 RepID=A0ABV4QB48_9ACTN